MKEKLERDDPDQSEVSTVVRDGKEYASFSGTTYEIVPPVPSSDFQSFTPEQSTAAFEIYRIVAGMLPLEGRDYEMKITFGDNPLTPSLQFRAFTELGRMWVDYLAKHMPDEVRKIGERKQ